MSRNIVEQYHDSLLNDNDQEFERLDNIESIKEEIEMTMKEYLKDVVLEFVPEELREYFGDVDIDVTY